MKIVIDAVKSVNNSHLLRDNTRKAIAENQSARLDKSDLIKKTSGNYIQKLCAITSEFI